MSDAIESQKATPFPAEGAALSQTDPLAGDWSDGLRGAARALGIPEPKLLQPESIAPVPPPPPAPAPAPAPVAEVEAPVAWETASEDPLQSQPPPAAAPPPPALLPDTTPPSPAPAFIADKTPPSPAPAFLPEQPAAPSFEADKTPPLGTRVAAAVPAPAEPSRAEELWSAPPPAAPPAEEPSRAEEVWSAPPPAAPPAEEAATPWSEPVAPAPAAEAWSAAPVAVPAEAQASPWSAVAAPVLTAPAPEASPAWPAPPPAGVPAATGAAPATEAWSMAAPEAPAPANDAWSAAPAAPVAAEEWKAEAPADEWQEIKRVPPPELGGAQAADWSSLSKGPDWSAPPPAEAAAASDDGWGAPPPAPAAAEWPAPAAAAADDAWAGPPAAAANDAWSPPPPSETAWSPPAPAEKAWSPPAPPQQTEAWNAPPKGASALEQLESQTIEPVPGAAQELFGSVPAGGSLTAEEEEVPPDLKPVELSDDDANLLVPIEEDSPPPPAQPLAQLAPVSLSPLEVRGEHRVAVHTRGGRTVRGSVKDVDLAKSSFLLSPQGGGDYQTVYHSDVKAIFFMLAPGEESRAGDGVKVRVTFADGRIIEGQRDGADTKHGFFLVPFDAQRTNTRRIYVAREATSEVKEI